MVTNIPINNYFEGSELLALLKPKPLRPDQVNWPRSQRKRRKNARRAFAAGDKTAFNR
jgi:hypothetical protein